MDIELEAKWLDINHFKLREKLKVLGALQVRPLTNMVRAVFDDATGSMGLRGGWVRVRDEGDKITMSYKQVDDISLTGTKEINLVVDDFNKAVAFLKCIGLRQKSLQETKRESWILDGAEIDLDEWPWLPPFVEVEAQDEKTLINVARKLELNMEEAMHGSVDFVYEKYYDVTCEDVNSWEEIKFADGSIPEWLENKKMAKL